MNYRDVAVLNDSLDSLSSNLLKQKMLREQAIERQAQTGLASQRLATDQAFREAQQKHYNNMESKQAEAANLAQTRAQIADKSGTLRRRASNCARVKSHCRKRDKIRPRNSRSNAISGTRKSRTPPPTRIALRRKAPTTCWTKFSTSWLNPNPPNQTGASRSRLPRRY